MCSEGPTINHDARRAGEVLRAAAFALATAEIALAGDTPALYALEAIAAALRGAGVDLREALRSSEL